MKTTPLRQAWNGQPVEVGDAWTLSKNGRVARCAVVTHQFGWELRLMVGELRRSQVCRSTKEILDHQASWKAAMIGRGWV